MGGRVSACDSGVERDKASLNGISRTRWCDRAEWGAGLRNCQETSAMTRLDREKLKLKCLPKC